jgi:hypothetical protein
LPDDALFVKVDRFAFTGRSFCSFFSEMEKCLFMTRCPASWNFSEAFEDYDTDAILDHYVFPCTIISDTEKITPSLLQTKEELRAGVDYVLSLHRQIDYRSGQLLLLDITELSPRLTGMMILLVCVTRMEDRSTNSRAFIRLRA